MTTGDYYAIGAITIAVLGWIGGGVTLSVRHHLELIEDLNDEVFGILLIPSLAGMCWPIIFALIPLVGLGYLGHECIGCIVRRFQHPKSVPENTPEAFLEDSCLVDAKREVEEICR